MTAAAAVMPLLAVVYSNTAVDEMRQQFMDSCPDLSPEDIEEMVNMSFVDDHDSIANGATAEEGVPPEGVPPP